MSDEKRGPVAQLLSPRLGNVVGVSTRAKSMPIAKETHVMTARGVLPIASIAGYAYPLLTDGGHWIDSPITSFGSKLTMEVTLSRSGVIKTIRATPDHSWLLRTYSNRRSDARTVDLCQGDRLDVCFPVRPPNMGVDREAAARGFVFGDGSMQGNRSAAYFCGLKDEALLPFFEGCRPPRRYGKVKRISGLPAIWKSERPSLESEPNVLYGWLAGYFAADGDVDKTGRPTLASAKRGNLEYVRDLGQAVGVGTFGIRKRMRKGYGLVESPLYLLGLMRRDLCRSFFILPSHRSRFELGLTAAERRFWNVVSIKDTGIAEEVYWTSRSGTASFTLEDNILTGKLASHIPARKRTVW